MHIHVKLEAIRHVLVGNQTRAVAARAGRRVGGAAHDVRASKFTLADADAAGKCTGIVEDTVVGDLQVMRQPWTKMPPPPWELSVTLKPSMLDGLQVKLLGYGLVSLVCVIVPFAL